MAEMFYGPWRVVVQDLNTNPQQGFLIAGSDFADGLYEPEPGVPMEVAVSGTKWTIDLQMLWPFPPTYWLRFDAVRATQFVAQNGLTVFLKFPDNAFPSGKFALRMMLHCISTDPEINPVPPPNPYDFTISKATE